MTDLEIRQILRSTILRKYYYDPNSKVVEELDIPVSKARIDLAVINGQLHGYEIKSAKDTLKRIPSQIDAYSKVFDYLTVITESRYSLKLLEITPEWVGVSVCQENGDIVIERVASLNEGRQSFFIAKLLWKDELHRLLEQNDIKFKKSDRNWILCEALSSSLSLEDVADSVRLMLKSRIEWKNKIFI